MKLDHEQQSTKPTIWFGLVRSFRQNRYRYVVLLVVLISLSVGLEEYFSWPPSVTQTGPTNYPMNQITSANGTTQITQSDNVQTQAPSSSTPVVGNEVQAALPSCPNTPLYSVPPIPVTNISYILPLGSFNPLPTDHMYYVITKNGPGDASPVDVVDFFAPGDMTIFRIGRQIQTTNGKIMNTDYFAYFAACKEVSGLFGHVTSLFGALAGIDFTHCDKPYSIGNGSEYEHCTADVNIKVKAGEKIGTAGGKSSSALDFGNDDSRLPMPYVANPAHHYDFIASCSVDYYQDGEVKERLQKLLGQGGDKMSVDGYCGEVFQDRKGTLAGNWFGGTPDQTSNDVTKLMVLGHTSYDPSIAAISIGGTITSKGEGDFTPTHTGTINRVFSEVTPSDTVYCYETTGLPGRILIQLGTETTMKIEDQTGACSSDVVFHKPFDYQR